MKYTFTLLIVLLITGIQPSIGQDKTANSYLQNLGKADSLYSKTLKEYRTLYVQLPENYQVESGQKYPVVLILDGENLLPTVHNVQSYYSGGFTPEMVLVGISNAENRTRDLTPSSVTELYGMPTQGNTGGAASFTTFINEELIPYLEAHYPVTSYRTLIGHSYGGLYAIYTLLEHPGLFSNYIAIDPSLDWDNQYLVTQAESKLANNNYKGTSLFMSLSGQLHMQDPDITLENVMQDSSDFTSFARANISFSKQAERQIENGLSFFWKFYPDDLHGTIPFPSIHQGLIENFKWYQMEDTDKFNNPETSASQLSDIIERRARKLKDHFGYDYPPYPEELLNVLGYMSMDMGQPEKSKMYLEYGIEYYPNSANAYDSMAEYYESQEDYQKALKLVSRAYELSGSDYHLNRKQMLQEKVSGK